jgi:hypothetical protein
MDLEKGWLPENITQGDLDDGDFAWLSDAYKRGDESKSKGRKLPYKIHSKVNEAGWKAAWSRAHSMADEDFDGGPSRTAVLAKLKKDKPAGVDIEDDGKGLGAREYKTLAFKAGNSEGLEPDQFQGYLATFGNIDDGGDVILPGAFTATLPDFLANGVVCWQHDWATPIGKWLSAHEDPHGLFVKGQISQTTAGKDALILLRDQVIKKMSIGYTVLDAKTLTDEEGIALVGEVAYMAALRNLPWYQDGVRGLIALKLYEGSPVTVPMNPQAAITGVKGLRLLAGLPHDDHFSAVHAAVGEYVSRVKAIADLRRKAGRVLSTANAEKLQTMRDSLASHTATLDDLLSAAAPIPADGDTDDKGAAIRASLSYELLRFERMQASLNGVL